MYFGLLISNTSFVCGSFRLGAEIAADMGYHFVELGMSLGDQPSEYADLSLCSLDEVHFIAQDIRATGIEISAIQCHTGFTGDDDQVAANVDLAKRAIDYAAEMHAPVVSIIAGPQPTHGDINAAWASAIEACRDGLEYADALPVQVAIHPAFDQLVCDLNTTQTLLDRTGRDDLGIDFNPSHLLGRRESPLPFVRELADRIVHVSASDACVEPMPSHRPDPGAWDMGQGQQCRLVPPGHGSLDWDAIIAALRDSGFEGALSLELAPAIADQEQAARDNVRFFRTLLGQI